MINNESVNIASSNDSSDLNNDLLTPEPEMILIKSSEGSYCFHKNIYDKNPILKDIITKFEFDKIINQASKIMGNAILKKREADKFEVSYWIIGLSTFSVLLVIFYLFLIYVSQTVNSYGSEILYASLFLITLSIFIILIQSLHNFFRSPKKYRTLDQIIREDLETYFKSINNTFYFSINDDKYVFTGSLHFNYVPNKREIECLVEKARHTDNYLGEIKSPKVNEGKKLDLNIDELKNDSNNRKFSSHSNSVIIENEFDENYQMGTLSKNKNKHIRVKSTISVGNKSYNLTPKEVEYELNKTHSMKT
jgi:hypothetical protein